MNGKLKAFLKRTEPWQGLAALVCVIVGGYIGGTAWVRNTAQQAVLDERFLATLSGRIRPTCIFDSHETIEADFGTSDYIEGIRVIPAPKVYGFEVVIKAKRHLAYAPLVSSINVDLVQHSATRLQIHGWSILMVPQSTQSAIITDSPMDTNAVYHFKLEILH